MSLIAPSTPFSVSTITHLIRGQKQKPQLDTTAEIQQPLQIKLKRKKRIHPQRHNYPTTLVVILANVVVEVELGRLDQCKYIIDLGVGA